MLTDMDPVPVIRFCGSDRFETFPSNEAALVPSANGDAAPSVTLEYVPSAPRSWFLAVVPLASLSRQYACGDAPSTLLTKTWLEPATVGCPIFQVPPLPSVSVVTRPDTWS